MVTKSRIVDEICDLDYIQQCRVSVVVAYRSSRLGDNRNISIILDTRLINIAVKTDVRDYHTHICRLDDTLNTISFRASIIQQRSYHSHDRSNP